MIDRGIDHVSGHSQRQIGKRPECSKIARLEGRTVGLDNGKTAMTVNGCAAVAWDMLEDRQNTPRSQARGHATGDGGNLLGGLTISAIADDIARPSRPNVGNGKAVHVNA